MKKDRGVLEKELKEMCINVAIDTSICNKIYDFAKEKYDIPKGLTSDIICLRKSMEEVSEFILFCIFDSIKSITKTGKDIEDFYTKQEIKKYTDSKYEVSKIEFPIRLKMIQVTDDQWIGSVDSDFLMKLRAAQLINYNVNAQRTMQKIIKGDKEIYKITLNQTAVSSIENSLGSRQFIPNTITLNMPEDADFYYDDESSELVIKSIEYFDCSDGYHRYIALCKASDKDQTFNYKMELRIINFSEDKTKRFIYQEDQKTKMKKVDSNSFNMNNPANIVITKLNDNSMCNIYGLIGRNGGIINFGEMSELINYLFFKNNKKENERKLVIDVTKELVKDFNMLTEYDEKYITEKYSYKQLAIIIYMFYCYKEKNKSNMCDKINKVIALQDSMDSKKFYSRIPRKSMINEIERVIKLVENNV